MQTMHLHCLETAVVIILIIVAEIASESTPKPLSGLGSARNFQEPGRPAPALDWS